MSRRTVWIIAGVLVVAGAAASVAAVGHREGRFGRHGGMMDEMGFGGGDRMGGDRMGAERMGRGWFGPRSITQDEFDTRTRERFARLDKNSDGVIDAAEIEAGIAGRMGARGERMREMMLQRVLGRFDASRDGKVVKDEFLARVKKEFARADLNNDGRITDDDLPPMMRGRDVLKGRAGGAMRGGPRGQGMGGPGMMLGWMIEADANKDGVITLDEVLAAATKRFEQLDRNKDGVIDKADFEAMHKEMVAYQVQRFLHGYEADKDGKVTREQYFKAAKEKFAERDVNRDGRIDAGDFGMGPDPAMGPGKGRGRGGDRGPGGPGMMDKRGGADDQGMRDRGPGR